MSKKLFEKLMQNWKFWELLALVLLIGGMVVTIATPLFDEVLLPRTSEEIIIRMYVEESGGYDPDVITVKKGETVKLILISMDMTHSFVIPELEINSGPVHPGKRTEIEFVPFVDGVYSFHCITSCSPMHIFMNGELVVT